MADAETPSQPNHTENVPARRTVFISHANPEDNEFTAWVGTRLIGAGYHAWSDLVRLIGGEPFWRDIGDAIKDHAAVVVLVLSRSSVLKPGVLDEIALAVATARKLKNPKFIIPIRLDDLPYDEFPEQVIRLNAINFNGNWAEGLHRLLEAIDERAISKIGSAHEQGIAEFRNFRLRQSAAIAHEPEIIEGSWLRITTLPATVYLNRYGGDPKAVAKALGQFETPTIAWARLGLGFARAGEIVEAETPDLAVEHGYAVDLQSFVAGQTEDAPQLRGADARRMITNLLRQAWENFATDKGLMPYEFANSTGWYVPRELIEKDTVVFDDRSGKRRRKRLTGRSEKRDVYWSFAVTVHPVVGRRWLFELKPQVVFTEDGHKPIDSKPKMARLRKSFCKNWWNDQWRTLLNAYVCFLADEDGVIRIPLGAWLGLVPRQHTTGGKPRLLGISKRGNAYLRTLLIHGARAALPSLSTSDTPLGVWLKAMIVRGVHRNAVVVALANKLARIAWAALRKESSFERSYPVAF